MICSIHNVEMTEKVGKYGKFYSHWDDATKSWCNDKPKSNGAETSKTEAPRVEEQWEVVNQEPEPSVYELKDRQSMAQTAVNCATEQVTAYINMGIIKEPAQGLNMMEDFARKIYDKLKEAKKYDEFLPF